jgi:hypothetical protein
MPKNYTREEAFYLLTKLSLGDKATTDAFIAECIAEVWDDIAARREQQKAADLFNTPHDRAVDKIQDGYFGKNKPTEKRPARYLVAWYSVMHETWFEDVFNDLTEARRAVSELRVNGYEVKPARKI